MQFTHGLGVAMGHSPDIWMQSTMTARRTADQAGAGATASWAGHTMAPSAAAATSGTSRAF